jgi:hypothetical protein
MALLCEAFQFIRVHTQKRRGFGERQDRRFADRTILRQGDTVEQGDP